MNKKYSDIINLPHKQSEKRPHMSVHDRAAQFAPFAALTGHDEAISETARLTDEKRSLSDCEIEALNSKLVYLTENLSLMPDVTLTYFKPDERKSGGEYVTVSGTVKRIDPHRRVVCMQSGEEIYIEDISKIDGDIFDE